MLDKNMLLRMKLYTKYLISRNENFFSELDNNKQKIVIALAADYGNLGDVAITYAQTLFLQDNFPHAEIIDFPISKTFTHMKSLKKVIQPGDIITIVGGGNTGDMYDDIEFCRQFIIKQFPNNRIISFPQTIDFSETSLGRRALSRAVKVYGTHKNLLICAREEKSFEKYQSLFVKNKSIMLPDIVLSIDKSIPSVDRQGITFVLRDDNEKNISEGMQKDLINLVMENYTIKFNDTHIDKSRMSVEERKFELESMWNVLRKSELVITDRLHGMIFCAITNTPCIAFDNSNKKVSGVYNAWLKNISTIEVMESREAKEVLEKIDYLLKKNNSKNNIVKNKFNILSKLLKE